MKRRKDLTLHSQGGKKIELLEMKGIYKKFPGVIANDNVNLEVKGGEIHALLGENGAGKTTLMNILYGIYQPDGGEIYINGKKVNIRSPRDAIELGIGMVHQHFMLIPTHTVAENICLGFKEAPFFYPTRVIEERIHDFTDRYGLKINPKAKIWQLSAGEQQRVEIIKTLLRGASLLILDEPTSVLTPQETKELFTILKKLVEEGHSVIFITHKLEEVMEISDRVTVLRKGKVVATVRTKDTNKKELARMMVGREVIFKLEREKIERGEEVLKVKDLFVENDRGLMAIKGVSFSVHKNEIFGIAGVAGNGQRELVEAITGLRKVKRGKIEILNVDVTNSSPKRIGDIGVAHIPEERIRFGIVPNLSVYENAVLRDYYHEPFSKGLFLNHHYIKEHSKKLVKEFSIDTPSIDTPVKLLSGGNIQKLILAREISTKSNLIIAAHPTYGLDVAATEYIRKLLLKKREEGAAILLVSEDLEEIFELSDRIAVIFEGKFMGIVPREKANLQDIGLMMAGSKRLEERNED